MPNIEPLLNGARALANSLIPFLLTVVCLLAGLYVIYSAIVGLAKKGSSRAGPQDIEWSGIAVKLLVGGLLLRLGATVEDISILLTGSGVEDVRGVLAYAAIPQTGGVWRAVFEVCLLWVVMLGWIGAFRGLLLWSRAADGGGGGNSGDYFWQGFWHLIGGAAAVNLSGMIKAFLNG